MDFEGEVHIQLLIGIEDGQPALGEVLEAFFVILLRGRRKGVERVPDRGAGEAIHGHRKLVLITAAGLGVEKRARGLAGGDHLLGGALADAFRIAVAPHFRGKDGLVPVVDVVADGLTDEVVGNGITGQPVVGEQLPFLLHVCLGGKRGIHVEVVAPAGEFEAVVAHFIGQRGEFGERQVGPLAGEESDGA